MAGNRNNPATSDTAAAGEGAATAANQTTIIGILQDVETAVESLDTKFPALGQAIADNSLPVVLPSAQVTTLTPQTDGLTDTELRASNVGAVLDSEYAEGDDISTTPNGVLAMVRDGSDQAEPMVQPTTPSDTQPVSGTVTANAGTNLNTSALALESGGNLDTIATEIATLSGAVDGTEMQVDIVSSALPTGAATAANQSTANTALGEIEGAAENVETALSGVGGALLPTAFDSYTSAAINLTTGANQVLVSSAASKQIWVYGYGFTCGDADGQTVSLQDEDDAALTGIMEFSQYGGIAMQPSGNFAMPLFKLGTDKDLEIDITGGDVDGFIIYAIVSV